MGKPYTDQEIAYILRAFNSIKTEEIAHRLGRTFRSIYDCYRKNLKSDVVKYEDKHRFLLTVLGKREYNVIIAANFPISQVDLMPNLDEPKPFEDKINYAICKLGASEFLQLQNHVEIVEFDFEKNWRQLLWFKLYTKIKKNAL